MGTTDKSPLKKGVHLRGVYAYEGYMYLLTGVSVKRSVSLRGVSVKRGSTVLSHSPKLPEVFGTRGVHTRPEPEPEPEPDPKVGFVRVNV